MKTKEKLIVIFSMVVMGLFSCFMCFVSMVIFVRVVIPLINGWFDK